MAKAYRILHPNQLPTVAICSLFRNSQNIIKQMAADRAKWNYPAHKLWHICVEGDSTDNTPQELRRLAAQDNRYVIIKKDFGTQHYPSIIHPIRMRVLAISWNIALEAALARQVDNILILDSDLVTPSNLLLSLLRHKVDVVAPLLLLEGTNRFRDTWGYWGNNTNFIERYPYHKDFKKGLFKMDSVGVPLMKSTIIRDGARFGYADEIRGLCKNIKSRGYSIYVDGTISVWHPPTQPVIGYG